MKANTNKDMLTIKKIENRLDHLDKKLDQYLGQLMINDRREDMLEEIEDSEDEDDILDSLEEDEQELTR